MFIFPLLAAFIIWSDADSDLLEPPYQWGRIIAITICVLISLVLYLVEEKDD